MHHQSWKSKGAPGGWGPGFPFHWEREERQGFQIQNTSALRPAQACSTDQPGQVGSAWTGSEQVLRQVPTSLCQLLWAWGTDGEAVAPAIRISPVWVPERSTYYSMESHTK